MIFSMKAKTLNRRSCSTYDFCCRNLNYILSRLLSRQTKSDNVLGLFSVIMFLRGA